MPVHDWTRLPSGLFHHFHLAWTVEIARKLNGGLLPTGLSALIERRIEKETEAGRMNRIVVKHYLQRTVAVIEIVSPGNKHSR